VAYRLRDVNNIPEKDNREETPGKWAKKKSKNFPLRIFIFFLKGKLFFLKGNKIFP
jgi:hypothetical protein